MKKIILIIFIFLLTGCYDYIEINDLAFISAISIDYENNHFLLGYEMLNTSEEEVTGNKTDILFENGQTISDAFEKINLSLNKKPYYHHLKVVIISKEIAKNHMKEVTDYLIRNSEIRNEFFLVLAENAMAKDVINLEMSFETIGENIAKLIETSNFSYNIAFNKSFEDILEKFLNDKIDAVATVIDIKEDNIILSGLALFKNYQYKMTIDSNNASIFNILSNNKASYLILDDEITIKMYNSKAKYDISDDKVLIKIKVNAEILENTKYDLRNNETYTMLESKFKKRLENDLNDFIKIIKENDIDCLGLNNMQYKKTKKNKKDYLEKAHISFDIDFNINRKGLIYKVENE